MGPTDAISVTFNQPMDHASVQAHFSLKTGGEADPRHLPLAGRQERPPPQRR